MKNIVDGLVETHSLSTINDYEEKPLLLRRDDVLLNRTNSPAQVGKVGIVDSDTDATFASYLVRLVFDKSLVNPKYMAAYLSASDIQEKIRNLATRAVSQANINPTTLRRNIIVPVPPLGEQESIARLLRTWDAAIRLSILRATAERSRTAALAERLLGSRPSWPTRALHEVASPVLRRNDGEHHPVMTISSRAGFILQSQKYQRDMAGASLEKYTLLRSGEFAYNRGNSLTYPQGCVYRLSEESALVPNVYTAFRLNESLDSQFYSHYFSRGMINRQLEERINSGVRGNGLLNISSRDFFTVKVPIPPAEEQQAIGRALERMRDEAILNDRKINLLREQKRGLAHRLFSGELRVKEFSDGVSPT